MSESFDLDAPDRFTAGTVGPPGQRTFFLQARQGSALVTLKAEKEQVGALSEYLAGLLARLPEGAQGLRPLDMGLVEPIEPVWAVGSLGAGYDEARDRVLIVATEVVPTEDGDDADDAEPGNGEEEEEAAETEAASPDAATARFSLTRGQAAAFVNRARSLVKAGRPTCPMCGRPKDPSGHVCPSSNGHVVHF
ncbi:MAG: DUF3090 domain-containing protein [Candidatus Rokubacteria bacterium]|nr:DUF3090 domain-containing protein [Candidatus Rokubacteria bacterium]MBI3826366.1 DUF3090 domain-containing protein [Candidatus Rokubacteria bacterium]